MGIFQTQKAIERLRDDLRELRTAVFELESANKRLSLEWEELYDKVRRQMARMSKRAAVDAKENGHDLDQTPHVEPEFDTDPISASILRRRGIRRQAG